MTGIPLCPTGIQPLITGTPSRYQIRVLPHPAEIQPQMTGIPIQSTGMIPQHLIRTSGPAAWFEGIHSAQSNTVVAGDSSGTQTTPSSRRASPPRGSRSVSPRRAVTGFPKNVIPQLVRPSLRWTSEALQPGGGPDHSQRSASDPLEADPPSDPPGQLTCDMIELPSESRPVAGGAFGDMFIGKMRQSGVKLALKRARFTLYNPNESVTAIQVRSADRDASMLLTPDIAD